MCGSIKEGMEMFEYVFHVSLLRFVVDYIVVSGLICYAACFWLEEKQ